MDETSGTSVPCGSADVVSPCIFFVEVGVEVEVAPNAYLTPPPWCVTKDAVLVDVGDDLARYRHWCCFYFHAVHPGQRWPGGAHPSPSWTTAQILPLGGSPWSRTRGRGVLLGTRPPWPVTCVKVFGPVVPCYQGGLCGAVLSRRSLAQWCRVIKEVFVVPCYQGGLCGAVLSRRSLAQWCRVIKEVFGPVVLCYQGDLWPSGAVLSRSLAQWCRVIKEVFGPVVLCYQGLWPSGAVL